MKPETVSTYKGKRSRRPSTTPRQYSGRHRNQYSQSGTETSHRATTAGDRHTIRVVHSFHIAGDRDQSRARIRAVTGEQATHTAIAEYCQSSAWTVRAEFYGFSEPIHRRKSVLIRVRVRDPTQGQEHLIVRPYTGQRATVYVYRSTDIQRPDKSRLHRGKSDLISGNCRR